MDSTVAHKSLVSVIMPVYNAEKYVKQAIQSILDQSYTHFELHIINDGSTDGSVDIIKSFTDERIHLVENGTNLGLIATLNKGFDLSHGKYIARMDADDVAMPNRLKKQVEFLDENPEVGVYGSAYTDLKQGELGDTTVFLEDHDSLKTILFFNSCMAHPTVMIRSEVLKSNELYYNAEFKHAEDYEFWVRLIEKTKFSNSRKSLLQYRIHDKQISHTEKAAQLVVAAHVRLFMIEKLGVKPTQNELRIHNAIGDKIVLKGFENIQYTEQWILKLVEANSKTHVVKEIPFNSYLALVFQDVCANSSVGIKAYRFYNRSVLAQYGKQGFVFKFKLFFKCLLR